LARSVTVFASLIAFVAISAWILNQLVEKEDEFKSATLHAPDYYMEDFTTTSMDEEGKLKNKLYAVYMAHYSHNNTTELLKPKLEFFRNHKPPLSMTADKGWVTAGNEVILLNGNVEIWENDEAGNISLQINTDKAKILVNQNYAESEGYTKITTNKVITTGVGMQAYINESKLLVLNDVHTTIDPR